MEKLKRHKEFYIPSNGKFHGNKKNFLTKIYTGVRRRLYHLGAGKVIVFDGPDGSGKTTLSKRAYNSLKMFKIKKEYIHYGASIRGEPKIERVFRLTFKIIRTYINKLLGKITITDRYIYLTFRKKNKFLKKFIRLIAPKPNLMFLMKASPEKIRERKEGQPDKHSKEMIQELYSVFDEINNKSIIDTEKKINVNMTAIANKILNLYRKN